MQPSLLVICSTVSLVSLTIIALMKLYLLLLISSRHQHYKSDCVGTLCFKESLNSKARLQESYKAFRDLEKTQIYHFSEDKKKTLSFGDDYYLVHLSRVYSEYTMRKFIPFYLLVKSYKTEETSPQHKRNMVLIRLKINLFSRSVKPKVDQYHHNNGPFLVEITDKGYDCDCLLSRYP